MFTGRSVLLINLTPDYNHIRLHFELVNTSTHEDNGLNIFFPFFFNKINDSFVFLNTLNLILSNCVCRQVFLFQIFFFSRLDCSEQLNRRISKKSFASLNFATKSQYQKYNCSLLRNLHYDTY